MKFLFTFLLLAIGNGAMAQVEIVAEQDPDRNLTFLAFNKSEIPYTIQLEFFKLENLNSPKGKLIYGVATTGKSTLVKLFSIYTNVQTGFQYNTKLFKGDYLLSPQIDVNYLVPVSEGTKVLMKPLTTEISLANAQMEPPYTGVGFYFEGPALVCAPRKGIVTEMKMDNELTASGPTDFEKENFIEIYHQDGSFSRLSGLETGSAKVSVGDTVYPGQAVAESTSLPEQAQYHVKMIQSHWKMVDGQNLVWTNFPVTIFTDQTPIPSDQLLENLQASHPFELISKEMDKKELKNYSKK